MLRLYCIANRREWKAITPIDLISATYGCLRPRRPHLFQHFGLICQQFAFLIPRNIYKLSIEITRKLI